MEKTIKQWLEELPEPYRSKARKNLAEKPIEYAVNSRFASLSSALAGAFIWAHTVEGQDYWSHFHSSLCVGESALVESEDNPLTLVVLDQDKLPASPIPELKSNSGLTLKWPTEIPIAKIACPELDLELMRNPPSLWDWYDVLTPTWATIFEKGCNFLANNSSCVPKYASLGLIFDDLRHTGIGFPQEFHPHRSFAHNYPYLVSQGIVDELRLSSIIGTSADRAAALNGEIYSSDHPAINLTDKAYEPFIQTPEGLTNREAIDWPKALDRTYEKMCEKLNAPNQTPKPDPVNHPSHYTKGDVECIDALAAATEGLHAMEAVCTANAIKYLWRWKHKNGVEDLKKAVFYTEKLIKELEK